MSGSRLADYVSHMIRAATDARTSFVEGMSREAFPADRRTQQAVVMSLVVIGEAAAKILEADRDFVDAHPEIPWRNMRGMRNRMAHGYFETDFTVVWDTVEGELPGLMDRLSVVAADLASDGNDRKA